jgi:DNA-binding transcriptional MerR regulator
VTDSGDQPIYSIGAVGQMLRIPVSTLRGWEERYGLTVPSRSRGSQRLYSAGQVEHLRFIKAEIEAGRSAADAHRLLGQAIEQGTGPGAPHPERAGSRPLVLIAERDPYAAELADDLLQSEGYETAVALHVVDARHAFEERVPDIVILDLLISGGAGLALCRDFATRGIAQLLAVSVLDSAGEARRAGARAFLRKPLEPRRLSAIVRDLLSDRGRVKAPGRRARMMA